MLLQQQAALAAQCIAAQVQSKSQLLSPQTEETITLETSNEESTQPASKATVSGDNPAASSQELSVAQMMMTLARASNKNLMVHNSGNSTQSSNPQLDASERTS